MIHKVKYGQYWLRQGRLSDKPTIYYHPGTVETAWKNFERRFPEQAGKGVVLTIKQGKVIDRVPTQKIPVHSV